MQIVIKIPEEEYKNICLMSKDGIGMILYDWIANGTPLPKGHGRLIDADVLASTWHESFMDGLNMSSGMINDFYDAPTIIEADKAESDEV
jgi:hypothetical protein